MTPQEFCYWLQGFLEMQQPKELTETQTQMVKDHLGLVFKKVTPLRGKTFPVPLSQEIEKKIRDMIEEGDDGPKSYAPSPNAPRPILRCSGWFVRLC